MDELFLGVDALLRHAICFIVPYPNLTSYDWLARAMLGLLLIGPLCATIGIQVVTFRMAFFSEAVGHSAFTGVALGLLLAGETGAEIIMIAFGVAVAWGITLYRRGTGLASDTVIGVFSTTVIAVGIALIKWMMSNRPGAMRRNFLETFLMGNILTITEAELVILLVFFVAVMAYEAYAYNRLMFIGLNAAQAQTMGVWVRGHEYIFSCLLALVVMFSIKAVGVLLVTAMLVIPAAAARNLARSCGGLFWWGIVIATTSSVAGLILADHFSTAAGASTILCATAWFLGSSALSLSANR